MSSSEQDKCPVDHETREAWIQKARQQSRNTVENTSKSIISQPVTVSSGPSSWKSSISSLFWAQPTSATTNISKTCPVDHSSKSEKIVSPPHPIPEGTSEGSVCPVDHNSRNVWLGNTSSGKPLTITSSEPESIEFSCSSGDKLTEAYDNSPVFSSNVELPDEREISSIPRTGTGDHWIYPSQRQFFNAMKRKSWDPKEDDMKTIVPLHNLVNEKAWNYILIWENENQRGKKEPCNIELTSFKGDSKKITPRAWIGNVLFNRELPFDRHDWVINRCGTRVDYVIDFYSKIPGIDESLVGQDGRPTFYLDVRPKLNTFEGCKLRVKRALGL